jgi:hypothetical protein
LPRLTTNWVWPDTLRLLLQYQRWPVSLLTLAAAALYISDAVTVRVRPPYTVLYGTVRGSLLMVWSLSVFGLPGQPRTFLNGDFPGHSLGPV